MREVHGSGPSLTGVDSEDPLCTSDMSAGNGASTLALKPMGRVNQSPKQRVPVAPQISDIVTVKKFLKKVHYILIKMEDILVQ